MGYDIVAYAPEFDAQIVQLQTHLWASDPARNAAYLRWKYADNPFLDEVPIRLALCDGRVVAMRGMFGALWQVDDSSARHLLPYADDFVVAPEHRNRGVAALIMKAVLDDGARRGFPFAVSLSAGAVTFVSSLAAGWRWVGSYQSVWRQQSVHRPLQRVRNLARRMLGYGRVDSARCAPRRRGLFDRLDRAGRHGVGQVSLAREPRPQAMADLVARLPWDGRIRHLRDVEYLAWRFRNPLQEYRFLFWDDGALRGYLVLQRYATDRADQDCVSIVDWEAADERIRADLLRAALRWGRFARVHAWTVGVSEPVRALLREHRFAAEEPGGVRVRRTGLLVHRLGNARSAEPWTLGSRDLLNIADWDLRMLYSTSG
jgi:GNAT superfamily N-acetyltransferase